MHKRTTQHFQAFIIAKSTKQIARRTATVSYWIFTSATSEVHWKNKIFYRAFKKTITILVLSLRIFWGGRKSPLCTTHLVFLPKNEYKLKRSRRLEESQRNLSGAERMVFVLHSNFTCNSTDEMIYLATGPRIHLC